MKTLIITFTLLTLASCGARRPGKLGNDGKQGEQGVSSGLDIADAGGICANGGVILSSFKDYNNDGFLDSNEPVHSIKTVCNGIDGVSASVNLDLIPSTINCPTGGVLISSSSGMTQVVCNGKDGLNGPQGIQGVQGIPGLNGQDGTSVIPVKFCSESTAPFPEYGLKIGDEVFAVYYDKPKAAFLALLTPGSYTTTTDNQDCNFTIE